MTRAGAPLPVARIPLVPRAGGGPFTREWSEVPTLTPFWIADGSRPAREQTRVRVAHDGVALHVRFDCDDQDIWGTLTARDAPIYEEEAVELFLAPGDADPLQYLEFEVSPLGTLFDARVFNPRSRREELRADAGWDCPGIAWRAGADLPARRWWAELVVPWSSLAPQPEPPALWRANFYRIERPRGGSPEFSCWSPTFTDPADFHRPACFGVLDLRGGRD